MSTPAVALSAGRRDLLGLGMRLVPGAIAGTAIAATGFSHGGFFPRTWGGTSLALLLVAAAALLLSDGFAVERLELVALGGLTGFVAFAGVSTLWSESIPRSVLEVQRGIVYVAALAAFLLVARGAAARTLLDGTLVASVLICAWAAGGRLLGGGPLRATPLMGPVDYWNGLGLVATVGVLLAVGRAAFAGARWARLASAATVPVFLVTLFFTFSRSAWLALGFGLVALVVAHPRRLRLPVPRDVAVAVVVVALPAGALLVAAAGGPGKVARQAYDAFGSTQGRGGAVSGQLLSARQANARADYWRVAARDVRTHPLLGSGAGTYELIWDRERPNMFGVEDAHSLYLETLAEVGPAGLGLLLLALGAPLLALRRRRNAVTATAAAAYVAYLVHAGVDWDWELPAVTILALACAAALLVAARNVDAPRRRPAPAVRALALAALGTLAAVAAAGQLTASALDGTYAALERHAYGEAAADARRAVRFSPWASEPRRALAQAEQGAGNRTAALRSFREAVARDPHYWRLWYELAQAASGPERTRALAAARRLNPREPALAKGS